MRYPLYDTRAILDPMRSLARVTGHDLDVRFAHAGLGAGPEAHVASRLVDYTLVGGGGLSWLHSQSPDPDFDGDYERRCSLFLLAAELTDLRNP